MNMNWLIRDYRENDLAAVIHLIDTTAGSGQESVFSLAECLAALTSRQPAVVAVNSGTLIGSAIACVGGDRAWVMRIAITPSWRGRGLASALLVELERRLVSLRVRRIAYVLPAEELLGEGLRKAGYTRRPAAAYYEKDEPSTGLAEHLDELGGQWLPRHLWDGVAGMKIEKELIERRVVMPLAEPERAARHGVRPPRAITLFGPPGTGKTTFARAIASRLGWPFVELLPSRLSDDGNLASALRAAFAHVAELEQVLVFIDEVEEIAPVRDGQAPGGIHSVTNELLKIIPGFRERDERLLICATNSVRSLDAAFLRPGRFDYVIPIGTPDREARAAIWSQYVGESGDINLGALVEASDLFTPADIEHASRAAAQAAFERDLSHVTTGATDNQVGASTDDYLAAIDRCRPIVTAEMLDQFSADISDYARV
jgi:transitional endoplasmic reticulum ATPase